MNTQLTVPIMAFSFRANQNLWFFLFCKATTPLGLEWTMYWATGTTITLCESYSNTIVYQLHFRGMKWITVNKNLQLLLYLKLWKLRFDELHGYTYLEIFLHNLVWLLHPIETWGGVSNQWSGCSCSSKEIGKAINKTILTVSYFLDKTSFIDGVETDRTKCYTV